MATIIKRKKNYSVVYYYETESGEKKQKWETFTNRKDANKRKIEIENQQEQGFLLLLHHKNWKIFYMTS